MLDSKHLNIVNVDLLDGDKVLVGYSDGSTIAYTASQLMSLTPETSSNDYIEPEIQRRH